MKKVKSKLALNKTTINQLASNQVVGGQAQLAELDAAGKTSASFCGTSTCHDHTQCVFCNSFTGSYVACPTWACN